MEVSSRHHLRSDEVQEIAEALREGLGVELDADSFELVELADEDFDVVLVDGEPLVWYPGGEPFVTVKGANEFDLSTGVVTVDAGAISFVSDGADIMRPGITDADDDISEGDLVVVEEETHGKALAVGRALTDGDDMVGDSGKVVENLHHVGDELFEFSV
ncbi:MAG: RNA-binding protein [Halobacterium sp.]